MTLADLLHASADRWPDRPVATDVRSGRSMSYGQLARESRQVACIMDISQTHKRDEVVQKNLKYIRDPISILGRHEMAIRIPIFTSEPLA